MRIVSFDVFDTLLTRLVAHPFEIFLELGTDLRTRGILQVTPEEFVTKRVDAENAARQLHSHREANLREIYDQLGSRLNWTPQSQSEAEAREIAIEQNLLRAVPAARRLVQHARQNADLIVFISDMYLPSEVIRSVLEREGIWKSSDRIYVSNEHRKSKASGELYRHIRAEFADISLWTHHGDNVIADVRSPSRHQIEAAHFSECELTRYERVFRPSSEKLVPLWASKFAGSMRQARLARPTHADPALWRTGANVIGPILYVFVEWCLRSAVQKNLTRLYFISREGEILVRIARIFCEAWGLPIECKYLYGSRQAWRLPAIDELGNTEKEWVIGPRQLMNVRACFARLGLNPDNFREALTHRRLPSSDWERNLTLAERERLWEFFLTPALKRAVEAEVHRCRKLAIAYLRQEGLCDDSQFAVVDIGWYGNLQKSLRKLLTTAVPAGNTISLTGLYFALMTKSPHPEDRMDAFWNSNLPDKDPNELSTALLESFTAASHGSVLGYRRDHERLLPLLEYERNEAALEWGLEDLQQSICEFARSLSAHLIFDSYNMHEAAQCIKGLYDLFYFKPNRQEAIKWGAFPFKGQSNEVIHDRFVPDWGEKKIIEALVQYEKRPTCWWMEGSLAKRFSPSLALFLWLKKWKNRKRELK